MKESKKTSIASTLITWGTILLIVGILLGITSNISKTDKERYGGDAYTGIQNAAADAANNVDSLSVTIIIISGISFVVVGTFIDDKEKRRQQHHDATQYQLTILNQNVAQLNAKLNTLLPNQPENQDCVAPAVAPVSQPIAPVTDNCPSCGTQKIPNTAFCTKCGAKFE